MYEIELSASLHAVYHPNDPLTPALTDAGYRRWVDDDGRVRILRSEPSLHGPWREEPIEASEA